MGFSTDKFIVCFGLITLAHSAYSAAQHRVYLRLTEQDFSSLPADILLQCLGGLVITCYGIVRVVGKFKEINAAAELEKRTWETLSNRPAFYVFNHRGKALYGKPQPVHRRPEQQPRVETAREPELRDSDEGTAS